MNDIGPTRCQPQERWKEHIFVNVAEKSCQDLVRLRRGAAADISVVHNGLNYPYSPLEEGERARRLAGLGICEATPFLLHVGGNQWYKNRLGVLKIFAAVTRIYENPLNLVMAGKPWTEPLYEFVAASGIGSRILNVGRVSNAELHALYSGATALLFPSWQEGFGWPIVEAQACGCPVFTSNRPPMNEVGGAAAVYFDPTDPGAAAETIVKHLPQRAALGEAGLSNAARFTMASMISGYIRLYEKLITGAETAQ